MPLFRIALRLLRLPIVALSPLRLAVLCPAALGLLCTSALAQDDPRTYVRPGENVARGKPYTMKPAPNYAHCTDPGDATQLTDGEYTSGYFWTQKTTVGWSLDHDALITFDLGKVEPIGGLSFHTAGGFAEVRWPRAIHLFVSDDGRRWWYTGELLEPAAAQNGPPPPYGTYATWRFWTDRLKAHGRYLALLVQEHAFVFADEVEIYRGDPALLAVPRPGRPAPDIDSAVRKLWYRSEVARDLSDVRSAVDAATLAPGARKRLLSELDEARADLDSAETPGGSAELPYGPPHVRVFAAQAALEAALGRPPLTVAAANRWDPLLASRPPGRQPAAIDTALMQGETRGEAFTLFSTRKSPQRLTLRFEGAEGPRPAWLRLRRVAWTGTREGRAVGSALPELASAPSGGWSLDLLPGLPQQVWVEAEGASGGAGVREGRIVLLDGSRRVAEVPVRVRTSSVVMPGEKTLLVSGWDYTDGGGNRYLSASNLDSCAAFLREHGVNVTWGTAAVLPFGRHADDGSLVEPPDTKRLDDWIARWPGARLYAVFVSAREPVADTKAARKRVAEWIGFYARHLMTRGIRPDQIALLLYDEPGTPQAVAINTSWARAIKAAQPEVRIFNDPVYRDAAETPLELLQTTDIMSPNRILWLRQKDVHERTFLPQRTPSRAMAFYSCMGPVRQLDPYSYHRLQAWDVWRCGGVLSSFWSFGDSGVGSSWNELAAWRTSYSPQYIDPGGCTTSKHMEAIRESQLDFEYLTMLRKRVEGPTPGSPAFVARARALLDTAADRVLAGETADTIWWKTPKDRSVADRVRLEILETLEME